MYFLNSALVLIVDHINNISSTFICFDNLILDMFNLNTIEAVKHWAVKCNSDAVSIIYKTCIYDQVTSLNISLLLCNIWIHLTWLWETVTPDPTLPLQAGISEEVVIVRMRRMLMLLCGNWSPWGAENVHKSWFLCLPKVCKCCRQWGQTSSLQCVA